MISLTGHYVILGILSFLFAVLIVNLIYIKRLRPGLRPASFPHVSILVPARNEEKNIEACVRPLLAQDYPDFEVLVLNDHSEDRTLEILEKIAAEDGRLRILRGEDLPAGWVGKCFACHQLAAVAKGEYLLFTDADTRHQAGAVAAALAGMEAEGADLLTLIPGLTMQTWAEKLILPLIPFVALAYLPFPLIKLLRNPKFSIGNGQFMLFRREVYEAIGGHKSVQSALVEDVWLARRVKAFNYTVSMLDGSGLFSCRMYRNFAEVWEGFSKNIFAGFNYSLLGLIAMVLFSAAVYVLPPVMLISEIGHRHGVFSWFFPAAETLMVIAMRLLLAFRFHRGLCAGGSLISSFFHPLGMVCVLVIAMNSARCILAGKGARWKGRAYKFHSQQLDPSPDRLSSFATLMLMKYPAARIPYAFLRMGFDPMDIQMTEGLLSWKLCGTGTGLGFSASPDWSRYALFSTWESPEAWESFLYHSAVTERFRKYAKEVWWVTLKPIQSRGAWNGRALFDAQPDSAGSGRSVAVLTRATIRWSRLFNFWGEVEKVSDSLGKAKGLLCSVGFGEVPWKRQATFSVWESVAAFEAFAYGDENHRRVIQRTRDEQWYEEEMFARFYPLASGGSWNGRDPLADKL